MYPESGSRNQRDPLPDLRPLDRLDHPVLLVRLVLPVVAVAVTAVAVAAAVAAFKGADR